MLSRSQISKVSAILSILSWLALVSVDVMSIYYEGQDFLEDYPGFLPRLLLILVFFFTFTFYRFEIGKGDGVNINDLIYKIFVTGLIATIGSLISRYLLMIAQYKPALMNKILVHVIYDANVGLLAVFLASSFIVWKKLILYQKSKKLLGLWKVFEVLVLASLLFTFVEYEMFDIFFNIVVGILFIFSLVLSVNLKWVAYLNFKQKWKNILLIGLVVLYIWYFFITVSDFSSRFALFISIADNVTVLTLFAFNILYAVFSILVLLFNLPTSSVFEQKLEEVINFQKLSQTANTRQDEEQIYDILLESSVSAVVANGAWLEIYEKEGDPGKGKTLLHKITERKKAKIEAEVQAYFAEKGFLPQSVRSPRKSQVVVNLPNEEYRSALVMPLMVQGRKYGQLCLLKDLQDGFNREMIEIIRSFVNQASISIENYQLIQEAIENERYKEELEIAKRVQGSLLPQRLERNDDFDITTFSRAAAEVGGDYYDTYRINRDKVAIIIGDVSGKGTSAAFHMSQMKGIFQSLSQLDLSVKDLIVKSNVAVSNCLDKKSLITASYFVINQATKSIEFTRAGHCPTLYYRAQEGKARFFDTNGLGLGILRNEKFEEYVEVYNLSYQKDDLLFLYTDGITEAKNSRGEEFGYERLLAHIEAMADKPIKEILDALIKKIYDFCGSQTPDDDFTTVIIKFK